ncbi:MAG: hypothetical protein EOP53_12220 [Sphingobacteriales bacterium]|nr:MAG: hypothetical protein EOP53_12220 [Sphingobacteriales bacterium]
MICILAQKYSPRLAYIADVLFGVILKTRFKILYISSAENALGLPDGTVLLNYSPYEIPDSIKIPQEKLLFEEDIRRQELFIKKGDLLQLYFSLGLFLTQKK